MGTNWANLNWVRFRANLRTIVSKLGFGSKLGCHLSHSRATSPRSTPRCARSITSPPSWQRRCTVVRRNCRCRHTHSQRRNMAKNPIALVVAICGQACGRVPPPEALLRGAKEKYLTSSAPRLLR
ncbi:unnamed protein product [Musa acuminata subsp. burmannicoides]